MRVLLVEDSPSLCETIEFHLRHAGHEVDLCGDGLEALELIRQRVHDVVLLDRMLPRLDGISVLAAMRRERIALPVLMITALDGIGERVIGLDAGADDYLVKPFAMEELLARVRSLGRRPREWSSTASLSHGDLTLDPTQLLLHGPGATIPLSKREAKLLEVFLQFPDQVLPREMLFTRVWGPDATVEYSNLDNYIHFLRTRLQKVGSRVQIKTRRAVGYLLK